MKYDILHTADWHLWHKHKYTQLIAGKHWDTFCEAKLNTLRMFIKFVQQNEVGRFIIAGDIFEHYNPIEPLRKVFVELINEIAEHVACVDILLGNHDKYKGQHALETARSLYGSWKRSIQIHPDYITINSIDCASINIQHCSVEHFQMKDKFYETGDMVRKKSEFDKKWGLILLGHYHKNQNDGRFFYCGSPYPCNFGEENNHGTFNVYTIEGKKFQFKTIKINGIQFSTNITKDAPYQIIRLQEECSPDKEAEIRRKLTEQQAIYLKYKEHTILDCIVEIKVVRDSLKGKTEKDIEVADYKKLIKALKLEKPFEEYIEEKFTAALEVK